MKTRTDFVSNSSSSSFIVMDSGNVDDIFKENHLTWAEYVNRFFDREVTNTFQDAINGWYGNWGKPDFRIEDRIKLFSDEEFVNMYRYNNLPDFALLERDKDKVQNLIMLFNKARKFNIFKGQRPVFLNGKENNDMTNVLYQKIRDLGYEAEDDFIKAFLPFRNSMLDILTREFKDKMFWYAECGNDGNGTDESEASKAMQAYDWHRWFNNH